jgi:Ring finger domain
MIALLENLAQFWLIQFIKDCLVIALLMIINSLRTLLALIVVIVYFFPFSAFMGLRYCYRRRRHPEQYANNQAAAQARRAQRANARFARKKKPRLMSQVQVDEKFPICSYKQAKVEQHNLPTPNSSSSILKPEDDEIHEEGTVDDGVMVEESSTKGVRNSIVKEAVISPDTQQDSGPEPLSQETQDENELQRTTTGRSVHSIIDSITARAFELGPDIEAQKHAQEPIELEEHEHLEELADDTCAICIEVMEENHQVRLLTCGHIFHSECVDPWLTARRAYCPLCKYDYYVPIPEEEENAAAAAVPQPPPPAQTRRSSSNLFGLFNRRRARTNASELSQASSQISAATEDSEITGIQNHQPAPMDVIPEAEAPVGEAGASLSNVPTIDQAATFPPPRTGLPTAENGAQPAQSYPLHIFAN